MPDPMPKLEGVNLKQINRGKELETTLDKVKLLLSNIDDEVFRRKDIPIVNGDLEQSLRLKIEQLTADVQDLKLRVAALE